METEFSVFEILLDELCAIEMASMTKQALDSGDKKARSVEIWNKIKYDGQIVAIARLPDDAGLGNTAARVGLPGVGLARRLAS